MHVIMHFHSLFIVTLEHVTFRVHEFFCTFLAGHILTSSVFALIVFHADAINLTLTATTPLRWAGNIDMILKSLNFLFDFLYFLVNGNLYQENVSKSIQNIVLCQ